jgi:hypothetical protein
MTKEAEDNAHATYGGSNCAIWINCPEAGRFMKTAKAGKTSSYAAQGTAAHMLAEKSLVFGFDIVASEYYGATIQVEEFENVVDRDMLDAVKVWHDYVSQRVLPLNADVYLEERVFLDHIWTDLGLTPPHDLFGTADAVGVVANSLHIFDYKHGSGVPVEADTEQGLYYASGALAKFRPDAHEYGTFLVTVHIIQPRAPHADGPVRSKTYTLLDIKNFENRVRVAIDTIESGKGGYNAGKWCKFCPKLAHCPEQLKRNIAIARGEFKVTKPGQEIDTSKQVDTTNAVFPPNAGMLSPQEISFVLVNKDRIKGWLDAVEQEGRRLLTSGIDVPDFKLVAKRELKKWAGGDIGAIIYNIEAVLGSTTTKLVYEDVMSPAQAKKFLTKEDYEKLKTAGVIKSASTGTTLAHKSDKRPAVSPGKAALSDFADELTKEEDDVE